MYSTATMIPPFQLLQADYPSTILRTQYDSTDAFDDSDCADALLQIRRYHGLTIPRTPFNDFADTLRRFRGHPLTIPWISLTMPRNNCGLQTRWIRGFRKVSCDVYHIYTVHRTWKIFLSVLVRHQTLSYCAAFLSASSQDIVSLL